MELKDTIKMMEDSDFKERFKAEYYQAKIRKAKLLKILAQEEKQTLPFDLACPVEMLKEQAFCMDGYIRILEMRAAYEDIDLY